MTLAEQRLRVLDTEIGNVRKDLDAKAAEQASSLQQEVGAREAADQKLQKLLDDTAAGDLTLETVGLLWLLIGTVTDFLARRSGSTATKDTNRTGRGVPCSEAIGFR